MRIYLLSALVLLLLCSCSSEVSNYPVGSDFIDSNVNIKIIDTFTINAGTFKLDSLLASSTSRILIGSKQDDNFGQLISQSYFQVKNSVFSISSEAVYDSIGLVLHYDNYYYGDTTQVQTYKVHRVTEYFEADTDDDAFYNGSKLQYDAEALGEVSFVPRPNTTTDSIYIPLDYNLGKELFEKIRDKDITTTDDFVRYFNGLTVIPDTTANSHVLGFKFLSDTTIDDNSGMRIFYTQDTDDTSEDNSKQLSFYVSSASEQFNAISANLEDTPLNHFENYETTISSEETNNKIFTQAGVGICARIEIPTLKLLNALSDASSVLKAELTFAPEIKNDSDKKFLKESLVVYVVDHKNRIVSQLTDIEGIEAYATLSSDEDEFNQNTYYMVNLSGFVQNILTSETDLNYALMIQFEDYDKTVDSVVINRLDENGNNAIKLAVTYLNY
ncbi:hypothetical protein PK35_07000 [Tamlana nanhaiensis]|uniref:DUF4270 domain-containing protein n=1 Tax=Neotamlana nanhaiensis TaxID=1382798 RepID=A0A0D7W371_9FLAO|nr:DUF4270 family protein [Tamlana nanhaiensis]KJD33580.1 hypothetical protein PK35_07000 [Tamlana nanhaiensis]